MHGVGLIVIFLLFFYVFPFSLIFCRYQYHSWVPFTQQYICTVHDTVHRLCADLNSVSSYLFATLNLFFYIPYKNHSHFGTLILHFKGSKPKIHNSSQVDNFPNLSYLTLTSLLYFSLTIYIYTHTCIGAMV